MLAVSRVKPGASACVTAWASPLAHSGSVTTSIVIVARIELLAGLTIPDEPTVARAEIESGPGHLAARVVGAPVAANKAVVYSLAAAAAASPASLAHTAVHARATHLARGLLVAFANANASFVIHVAVVNRKAISTRALEACIAGAVVGARASETAVSVGVAVIVGSVAVVQNLALHAIARVTEIARASR